MSSAETAVEDFQVVDSHLGFPGGVAGMKMRKSVIVEKHRDRDPEEAADRRHQTPRGWLRKFSPCLFLIGPEVRAFGLAEGAGFALVAH